MKKNNQIINNFTKSKLKYIRFSLFLIILFLIIFFLGKLSNELLKKENLIENHKDKVSVLAEQINQTINQRLKICKTLAKNADIIKVFEDLLSPNNEVIKLTLKTANEVSHTELLYLINSHGVALFNTMSDEMISLVGQNYSFRPYFKQAINGEVSVYPAIGVITKTRGLHLSSPVYGRSGNDPIGVLAMKIGISEIENLLVNKNEILGIMSPDGIIFSSNRSDWLFRSTRPISQEIRYRLTKTRQFDGVEISPLLINLENDSVVIDGESYYVAHMPLPITGWTIVSCLKQSPLPPLPSIHRNILSASLLLTSGLAILIFFLYENIQKRRASEFMLRQAEDKYTSIFRNAVMGIYQSSLEGQFYEVSPSMAKILGYESSDQLKSTTEPKKIYLNPEDRIHYINKINEYKQVSNYETQLVKKDGTTIWVSLSGRITNDKSGQEQLLEGFCLDITAKKIALEELQRERDIFSRVMETSPLSIILIDSQRRITFANAQAQTFLGISKIDSNFYREPPWTITDLAGQIITEQEMPSAQVIKTGNPIKDSRYGIIWPDGNRTLLSVTIAPLLNNNGKVTEMVAVLDDITEKVIAEQKAALQQKQLFQADRMISMGIMASGVAHEINNPNTFILSNAEILKGSWRETKLIVDEYYDQNGDFVIGGMPYSKYREMYPTLCQKIIDGSRRIKNIIKELKLFSRDEVIDHQEIIDINKVILSSEVLLSNMIKMSTNNFKLNLGTNIPYIKGSIQKFEQVIINILQNSCQSLENKNKKISITTLYDTVDRNIIIKCHDEGKGIEKDNLHHILDPFFTTKRDSGGTGLGLSVSEAIIRELKGSMDFESTPGQGTTVTLRFFVEPTDITSFS